MDSDAPTIGCLDKHMGQWMELQVDACHHFLAKDIKT